MPLYTYSTVPLYTFFVLDQKGEKLYPIPRGDGNSYILKRHLEGVACWKCPLITQAVVQRLTVGVVMELPTGLKNRKIKLESKTPRELQKLEKRYSKIRDCANCHQDKGRTIMRMCVQCKAVYYCSKLCQRSHWRSHRLQCARNE